MKKALIAMSGGVDSSVAAYLMKQSEYDCIGVTMKLFHNEDIGIEHKKTCCSLNDVEDAKSVAFRLGIPHYTFNFTNHFAEKVIQPFISAYESGRTPNPCIDCNRYLKFDALYHRAEILECEKIATGHYARIENANGRFILKKAVDLSKDQSYVLYSMTQEQLAHTVFPCGELEKSEIRKVAEKQGFFNADKPDSQDICFVPDGNYSAFIEQYSGKKYPVGNFIDRNGTVLGQHKGIIHYTIGQRKGLGISARNPLYVCGIDILDNAVILGESRELFSCDLNAVDFNWIAFDAPPEKFRAKAKIRYHHVEQWAEINVIGEKNVHIRFDEPQRAITKGQAVVLYDGEMVLGGGVIA